MGRKGREVVDQRVQSAQGYSRACWIILQSVYKVFYTGEEKSIHASKLTLQFRLQVMPILSSMQ